MILNGISESKTIVTRVKNDSNDSEPKKEKLNDQQIDRLHNAIWICKIGNFNETEALAFINSGEIGYEKKTIENENGTKSYKPIVVSASTYYRHKKTIESPEYQTKEVFKIFRDEYVSEIISRYKLFKSLEAKSLKALESESDAHKQQLIINGIFKNSPYTTSLMDIIKQIVERNKMPFPKNAEVEKILKQETQH